MADITPEQIVDALVPVIERMIARRSEDIYGAIEQLREEFQGTINIMDGNDHAIIGEIQRLRGQMTGEGLLVAEVMTKAAESWDRFVRGEAEKLGYKVIVPKGERGPLIDPDTYKKLGEVVERIEVRDGDYEMTSDVEEYER